MPLPSGAHRSSPRRGRQPALPEPDRGSLRMSPRNCATCMSSVLALRILRRRRARVGWCRGHELGGGPQGGGREGRRGADGGREGVVVVVGGRRKGVVAVQRRCGGKGGVAAGGTCWEVDGTSKEGGWGAVGRVSTPSKRGLEGRRGKEKGRERGRERDTDSHQLGMGCIQIKKARGSDFEHPN